MADRPSDEAASMIEEYQGKKRSFRPVWNRLVTFQMMPAFIAFIIGMFVPGAAGTVLVVMGFVAFAASLVRGAFLMARSLSCPGCGQAQDSAVHLPYRACTGCGARLSYGVKDSS